MSKPSIVYVASVMRPTTNPIQKGLSKRIVPPLSLDFFCFIDNFTYQIIDPATIPQMRISNSPFILVSVNTI